jgi:branched-chain amino acid aminotransferase
MNLMFVINNVLVTPSLSPSKLAGITRDSIIEIARHWGYPVEERDVFVDEVVAGLRDGSVTEAFGTGTAANIAPISVIGHEGEDFVIPKATEESFSTKALNFLDGIKTGRIADPFGWVVKI